MRGRACMSARRGARKGANKGLGKGRRDGVSTLDASGSSWCFVECEGWVRRGYAMALAPSALPMLPVTCPPSFCLLPPSSCTSSVCIPPVYTPPTSLSRLPSLQLPSTAGSVDAAGQQAGGPALAAAVGHRRHALPRLERAHGGAVEPRVPYWGKCEQRVWANKPAAGAAAICVAVEGGEQR